MEIKRLSTVAERQHGLVAIYQADLLGMSRRTWYRLIEGGVLVPVHQGVAAFVGSPPTAERAVMAAVLAAGPRSVAGARSAAWLWDCFDPPAGTPVDVMLRGRPAARTLDGVVAHRPVDHLQLLAVEQRGIPVVPDILANAGGVLVSYFEWVQNLQHFRWSLEQVRREQESRMVESFNKVFDLARNKGVPMRTAAFMLAIKRVGRARILGGIGS